MADILTMREALREIINGNVVQDIKKGLFFCFTDQHGILASKNGIFEYYSENAWCANLNILDKYKLVERKN